MWWNLTGLLVAILVTFAVSLLKPARQSEQVRLYTLSGSGFFEDHRLWHRGYTWLVVYFFALLGMLLALDEFAKSVLPTLQ
jgi:hypothetical protein